MVFIATKGLMLPAILTGSWPRPRWYNLILEGSGAARQRRAAGVALGAGALSGEEVEREL